MSLTHPNTRAHRRGLNKHYNEETGGYWGNTTTKDKYAPNEANMPYCQGCHKEKLQFETEKAALRFIEYNADKIQEQNGFAPIRAYYCKYCCCYHVTSKEKRYKKIRNTIA